MEVSCECNLGLEMQLKQKVLWEICAKFTKHHRWFIKYNTSGSLHCCVHWWEYLGFEIILNISSFPRTFVCPGRVILCISPWNNKIFVPLISTLSSDVIRRSMHPSWFPFALLVSRSVFEFDLWKYVSETRTREYGNFWNRSCTLKDKVTEIFYPTNFAVFIFRSFCYRTAILHATSWRWVWFAV